jgi:hypothetical protein
MDGGFIILKLRGTYEKAHGRRGIKGSEPSDRLHTTQIITRFVWTGKGWWPPDRYLTVRVLWGLNYNHPSDLRLRSNRPNRYSSSNRCRRIRDPRQPSHLLPPDWNRAQLPPWGRARRWPEPRCSGAWITIRPDSTWCGGKHELGGQIITRSRTLVCAAHSEWWFGGGELASVSNSTHPVGISLNWWHRRLAHDLVTQLSTQSRTGECQTVRSTALVLLPLSLSVFTMVGGAGVGSVWGWSGTPRCWII